MFRKMPIWSFICFVLSLLLAAGVMTVFHACEMKDDGTWMHCHNAQMAVAIVSLVLCVLFLISVLMNRNMVRILAGAVGIVGSLLIMFIPGGVVSMCMMHTMRCYTVMQPFVRIMAAAIAVFSALSLIPSRKRTK